MYSRIFLACLIAFLALMLPSFIFDFGEFLTENTLYSQLIKSLMVGLIAVLGIWWLRSTVDRGKPATIGVTNSSRAIVLVLFGFSLIMVPLLLTILISQAFGWAEYTLNFRKDLLLTFSIGMISTFFTDALMEELIFRGYIYSNIRVHFGVWKSAVITLIIFVLVPVIVISLQKSIGIEAAVPLSGNYVITLAIFGAFVQYLRILTNSIWAGVGFHLIFVHMNKFMGVTEDYLLRIGESSSERPVQITLVLLLFLVFIGLIITPVIKKRQNTEN